MSAKTTISWTDSTWNPVRGCTKVSAGCKNCYAETFAERWRGVKGHAFEQGFDLRLVPEALELPLRWKKPRRIFVNSMSDLFHEGVPDDFIEAVFGVMSLAGRHTFQVLTKRAARARAFLARTNLGRCQAAATIAGVEISTPARHLDRADDQVINGPWPLPNVWLGVSVEDQRAADERIPELLATPAAVRFLSCEPLLGPVDLEDIVVREKGGGEHHFGVLECDVGPEDDQFHGACIDWVIAGGESGPGARPCDVAWIRSLVGQCKTASVPAFCKQLGAVAATRIEPTGHFRTDPATGRRQMQLKVTALPLKDRKGGDPAEWPADLRVQQFPEVTRG